MTNQEFNSLPEGEERNADYILRVTNRGLVFYELILGPLKKRSENSFENVKNPFYKDGKAGLSIYFNEKSDRYVFYDHGDPEYKGDVFDFAALHFDLNVKSDFVKILEHILILLKSKKVDLTLRQHPIIEKKKNNMYRIVGRNSNKLTPIEEAFLLEYKIDKGILNENNVQFIDQYSNKVGSPQEYTVHRKSTEIMIAYWGSDFAKIYKTDPKQFLFLGNKPKDYIFGFNYIEEYNLSGEMLIITGGEKDVLVLNSLGYFAICLNSETANISSKTLIKMRYRFTNIIVLYDIDETGRKQSKILSEKYGFSQVILPEELKTKGGKDVADYVKLGLSIDGLKSLIEGSPNIAQEKLPDLIQEPLEVIAPILIESKLQEPIVKEPEENKSEIIINDTIVPTLDHYNVDLEANFLILAKMNEDKIGPFQIPRDQWIQNLARLCNLLGMGLESCLFYILKFYRNQPENGEPIDLKKHLIAPAKEIYKRYASENGKWEKGNGVVKNPYIPQEVFDMLPEVLKRSSSLFSNARERDLSFLGSLGVLSGCLPNLCGSYGGSSNVGANLFFFISAPASSGKSALKFARYLAQGIHIDYKTIFTNEMKEYKAKYQQYITKKKDAEMDEPVKPLLKKLFISGNVSAAALMQALSNSEGRGILFETEADTLTGVLLQDWGNFSDLLRKAFHHEWVSLLRKKDDDIELLDPHLSIVLSGTPGQLYKLIPDAENGLLSRIAVYSFLPEIEWKNVFEKKENSITDEMSKIGVQVKSIYEAFKRKDGNVNFELTDRQQTILNEKFSLWQKDFHSKLGESSIASIRRLGLITFRIAMILTALRSFENANLEDSLICSDTDFNSALLISEVLKEHAYAVFMNLPKAKIKKRGYEQMEEELGISKSHLHRLFN